MILEGAGPHVVLSPGRAGPAELASLVLERREALARTLSRSGAILFRGFGATEPENLAAVVDASGRPSMEYIAGDSPRTALGGGVYTSTEAPREIRIPLHNELSYAPAFPRHLWMACAVPATEGGATMIADGRAVLQALDPAVRDRFARRGVRYRCAFRGPRGWSSTLHRVLKASRSWMEAFGTDDAGEAESRCREIAGRARWAKSGALVLETERKSTIEHPETGDVAWFNQAHVFLLSPRFLGPIRHALASALFFDIATRPHHATYGNGEPIEKETLEHLHDVLDAHTIPVRWERGDVLWLDNVICMHGRERFRGKRRILLAMSR